MTLKEYLALVTDRIEKAVENQDRAEAARLIDVTIETLLDQKRKILEA